jgi:hypothetical protein
MASDELEFVDLGIAGTARPQMAHCFSPFVLRDFLVKKIQNLILELIAIHILLPTP